MSKERVANLQDRLAEALQIRGLRAIRLSEKTGIPKGAISYYLVGKSSPKADRLRLICEALEVSEAWLLGYDVPMNKVPPTDETDKISNIDIEMLNYGISKSVDILLELDIPEETIKQLILKHYDIRYSEITALLKARR